MTKTGKFFFVSLFVFGLIVVGPSGADEPTVAATIDRNRMSEGDTFTLSISVSSERSANLPEPRLPDFKDFDLVNSWKGIHTNSSFTNGRFEVTQSQIFNYQLAPKRPGQLEIGAAQVVINGKTYFTKPIKIDVAAGGPKQAPPQPGGGQQLPFEDFDDADQLFSQLLQRRMQRGGGIRTQPVNPDEAFFLQVEVDKNSVFVNEQVTASWYLYTRGQIRDIDTLKYPSLNGFWKEDIEIATRLDFTNEVVNGLVYKKALLASYALFPIKEGKSVIDSYKAKCTVLTLGQFGFGQPMVFTKASKPVNIEVKPLPAEGKPMKFTGAVGAFQVSAKVDTQKAPVNQPISLKVRFEGSGNAKLIDLPQLNLPGSVEVYDTKSESKYFKTGASFKEFEVLLIPREPGDIIIPALEFSAFDPNSKTYYQRSTEPIALQILASPGGESIPSAPMALKTDGEQPKEDPMPKPLLTWSAGSGWTSQNAAVLWGSAYMVAFAFLLWRSRVELGWGQKKRDLQRLLALRLQKARRFMDKGDFRSFGTEMTNAVYFLLGETAGAEGAMADLEKLLQKAPPSLRREVGQELTRLMASFEALSFAPESMLGKLKTKEEQKRLLKEMDVVLSRAVRLISEETKGREGKTVES